MSIFSRFLLPAAAIFPLTLTSPVIAQEGVAKPAKSAQDCAEELLRNKEAIEAGGETPQEFFHRCWWDSVPGKPTPIKTPRATWDPGRSHPPRTTLVKPPIETKRQSEAKRPIEVQKASHAKSGEQGIPEGKRSGATKQASEVKPAVSPKVPTAPNRPIERETIVEPRTPVEATTAPKPAKREAAASKVTEPAPAAAPKKKETAAKTSVPAPRAQAPKATSVITAPNAAPASVKPAASGEVVVQSRPKRAQTRTASVNPRRLPHEIARPIAARPLPPVWRQSRHVATHSDFPHSPGYAHHPRPFWTPPHEAFARRAWAAQGPVLCVYAAPDARGRSACVPVQ